MITGNKAREKYNNRLHENFVKLSKFMVGYPDPIYGEIITNVLFKQSSNRMKFCYAGNTDRIEDDMIYITKNHNIHVEVIQKHEMPQKKINTYINENLDCVSLRIQADDIFTEWSEDYILEILRDRMSYEVVSIKEPYEIKIKREKVCFCDFSENSWYFSFQSGGKNYIFLKEKFESYSNGVKNIINSMKDDNTIIYSKNYDISVSLKANILNKIKIDIL